MAVPKPRDYIHQYLSHRAMDVAELTQAIERSDFALLQTKGSSLKGSGDYYGFAGITEFAVQLENAAKMKDLAAARSATLGLSEYLWRFESVFKHA